PFRFLLLNYSLSSPSYLGFSYHSFWSDSRSCADSDLFRQYLVSLCVCGYLCGFAGMGTWWVYGSCLEADENAENCRQENCRQDACAPNVDECGGIGDAALCLRHSVVSLATGSISV